MAEEGGKVATRQSRSETLHVFTYVLLKLSKALAKRMQHVGAVVRNMLHPFGHRVARERHRNQAVSFNTCATSCNNVAHDLWQNVTSVWPGLNFLQTD